MYDQILIAEYGLEAAAVLEVGIDLARAALRLGLRRGHDVGGYTCRRVEILHLEQAVLIFGKLVSIWIPHILEVPLRRLLSYSIIVKVSCLLPLGCLRLGLLTVAHVFNELSWRFELLLSSKPSLLLLHLHHHASLLLLLFDSLVI